jgi:hypothetical protein
MGSPRTLIQAIRDFANADNCREYLIARRWPNGVACPTCGSKAVYFDKTLNGWKCKTKHPQQKFTLKTGTIFEDSPLGFDKWLPVVWLITNCKNGVSSYEVQRAVGVTQKTAWFMLQRIRLAMQDGQTGGMLGGEVEVDETFIGGRARNMSKARKKRRGISQHTSMASKAAVMGLLERHPVKGKSKMRLKTMDKRKRKALISEVNANVSKGATVHTDALRSYLGLSDEGYIHNVIDHAEAYADGQVDANGCENFWSL